MIHELIFKFQSLYQTDSDGVFFAPGRVNIIGEHTDYNGGHVFPCALDIGTYLVVSKRKDLLIRFYSENFSQFGIIQGEINNLTKNNEQDWTNYPKGVMKMIENLGFVYPHGLDVYYYGDLPNRAGLSSSASIEVVTAVMLNDIYHLNLDPITLVKLSQKAENSFVGLNCGIMDPFASEMGKKDHAILLDTNSLHYNYVPLDLTGYTLVITNTNKCRGLKDSKYNERRNECEQALSILKQVVPISSLGDLSIETFNQWSSFITDPTIRKRAKHAVYENVRTLQAKKALDEGNLIELGKLLNASHCSLRDDYEVTGLELDTLVTLQWNEEGVLGSRMTGAGFGGCTVSIVQNSAIDSFKTHVEEGYKKIIGYKPTFYIVNVGDGGRKLL